MWYVIQTKTGYEHDLVRNIIALSEPDLYRRYIIPVYEDVKRTGGVSRITYRKIFPGYVLIDTDVPKKLMPSLNKANEFATILSSEEEDKSKQFIPVEEQDIEFLDTLYENGVMSVSYVERVRGSKVERIIGPLAKYGNHIVKIDFRRRRAIVEAEIFGKKRRIKFGLWTDEDPKIPWIEEVLKQDDTTEYLLEDVDIGIHPGDMVRDVTGMYGDETFEVESVNTMQRTFATRIMILGEYRSIEMFADNVEVV